MPSGSTELVFVKQVGGFTQFLPIHSFLSVEASRCFQQGSARFC
jgi:hypothetical protein